MHRKKALLAAVVAATLTAPGTPANAVEIKLSGQVNRALMHADDGIDSDLFNVDNDNSSTRFRFDGSADVIPGIKAGVLFEVEYQSSPSNVVNFANRNGPSPEIDERHMDVYFQGGFGKLSLGQGDGAANGGVEVDLSGTSVVHYADISATGGAIAFRTAAGGSGPAIGNVLSQQDFESRYDRLRYDTPSFGGFGVAFSHGVKDSLDVQEVALRYSGELGALGKLAGVLGHSEQDAATPGANDDKVFGGSVSWLLPGGLNFTFGHTERDVAAVREGEFNYFKVGYKLGKHAVSADYAMGDDQSAAGDEGKSMSLAYVFTPISWAEVFALGKQAQLDQPGARYEDIRLFMVGTRLKF